MYLSEVANTLWLFARVYWSPFGAFDRECLRTWRHLLKGCLTQTCLGQTLLTRFHWQNAPKILFLYHYKKSSWHIYFKICWLYLTSFSHAHILKARSNLTVTKQKVIQTGQVVWVWSKIGGSFPTSTPFSTVPPPPQAAGTVVGVLIGWCLGSLAFSEWRWETRGERVSGNQIWIGTIFMRWLRCRCTEVNTHRGNISEEPRS